jgi:hypothetical protein
MSVAAVLLGATLPARQATEQSVRPASLQRTDPDYAAAVREWTTAPEFLSPLVDHLPLAAGVPTPKDVLGYHIGAPKQLTYTRQAYGYYRKLAAASPRVKVTTIGTTDEGRELLMVFVASEATLRDLDTYRSHLARLADPRGLTPAQAAEVVTLAKPMYVLLGGLHSSETGPPEMLMELAYRLAADESPLVRQIRDEVIVAILPVADPDGRDRYVDWYYKYQVDIDDETRRLPGPPYWGKYVFHDINRDINYSQRATRAVLDWYLRWFPPIVHDLHESVPFLYTFSGQAPQNPTLDPILYAELPWFANFEMAELTRYGMPGVWTHGFVDMWSPGYLAYVSSNHNGLVRLYETFGNAGATTMKRRVAGTALPGGVSQTTREWYRPLPPYRETVWSMRNNTNYMETAVLAALQLTSRFAKTVLENFYVKSRNSIEAGRAEPPFAFVIPAGQKDRTRVARLVNLLRRQGIEVARATVDVGSGDANIRRGDFIVRLDQPYGRLAKILLEKQAFPDPQLRTYDDTAWTMGLMLHTEVRPVSERAILEVPVDPLRTDWAPVGTVGGERGATHLVVPHHGATAMTTLRYRLKDLEVAATERAVTVSGLEIPAGSYVIATQQQGRDVTELVRRQVEPLGLPTTGVRALPDVPLHAVDLPRVAVFSTWGHTQEVGWVRFTFEQFEIPFDLIHKERVAAGDLRASYDVILIPSQGRTGARYLVFDIEPKDRPLPYQPDERFPSLGAYGQSDDITGGMGLDGVVELRKFAESGGVLVTLGVSSYLPAEFSMTRLVTADRPSAQFYAPGPIVEAEVLLPAHPLLYGYPDRTLPVRYANGPLLSVPEADRKDLVVMRYRGGDWGVLSGLLKNAHEVAGRPALLDVPLGAGRLVLFAGNPCYRWQNHGEFGMLFNSILHWNDRPAAEPARSATGSARGSHGR